MKNLIILLPLVVCACANDRYTVLPHTPASQERLRDDLWTCKMDVLHSDKSNDAGAIAGGLLGGAIGGAIGGALTAPADKPDPNVEIEKCMASKGYAGTSEN